MVRRLPLFCLLLLLSSFLACCRQADVLLPATQAASVPPAAAAVTLPLRMPPSEHISPATGTTGVTLNERAISADGILTYELAARAGQMLGVSLQPSTTAEDARLAMRIISLDEGTVLQAPRAGINEWSGLLPDDGLYEIAIINLDGASRFSLAVSLPERVNFVAGAISAVVKGSIVSGYSNEYLVAARAGQTLTATVTSPQEQVWLGVASPDGQPLVRSNMGLTRFSRILPTSGDYAISLQVIPDPPQDPLPYSLVIDITD